MRARRVTALRPRPALPTAWVLAAGGALGLALIFQAVARTGPRVAERDPEAIPVLGAPVQEPLIGAGRVFLQRDGFDWTMTPLARYTLRGIVVHVRDYRFDWNAAFAPRDVAMVWGRLAEEDLYKRLSWSQDGRWYFWRYGPDLPIGNDVIAANSSNTHLIPANANLEAAARSLRKGDVAELSGELVRLDGVRGEETRWWVSSQSRDDQGDGSCEVLWLKRLKVRGVVYE